MFDIEPVFVKNVNDIKFFNEYVFSTVIRAFSFDEGIIFNKNKEGMWNSWYFNNQKRTEGKYRIGLKEDLWIYWYRNGQKESERRYLNGNEEEVWKYWFENGQIRGEDDYHNGEII